MKRTLTLTLALICSACSNLPTAGVNSEFIQGAYNPQTLDSVDAANYKADKALCYKQVQSTAESSMSDHYNIIKFRDCLVKKGYVLMS
jgi:hypothetical protein